MKSSHRGQVRIIAGELRGRRIHFPTNATTRPTPDRVRETLFNWLNEIIHGSRCLDCFAGSGVLGLEALSRGAASVVSLEADRKVMGALKENAEKLQLAERMQLISGPFPRAMHANAMAEPFDIVFIDPPFHQGIVEKTANWLEENKLLSDQAMIYIEIERRTEVIPPANWHLHRQTDCGEGKALLFRREEPTDE